MGYVHAAAAGSPGPGEYAVHRPQNVAIEPGDIVVRGRAGAAPKFSELGSGEFFPTHGDMVISTRPDVATAIGGNNKDNSVGFVDYELTPAGRIADKRVFVVLRRNG